MHRRHAFSLVELVVVMAVIALLTVGGIAGYNLAQQTSRDQERKSTLVVISTSVDNYFRKNGRYPGNGELVFQTNTVTIFGQVVTELKGYLSYVSTGDSTATQTRYAYFRDGRGYIVCAKLESGIWDKVGIGSQQCPTN